MHFSSAMDFSGSNSVGIFTRKTFSSAEKKYLCQQKRPTKRQSSLKLQKFKITALLLMFLKSYSKQVERKLALIHFLLILNGEAWEVTSSSALIWLKVNRERFLGFTISLSQLRLSMFEAIINFNLSRLLSSQIQIKSNLDNLKAA